MSGNVILILVTILACIAIVLGVKAWNMCNEVDKERDEKKENKDGRS